MDRVTLACGHSYVTNADTEDLVCLLCHTVEPVETRDPVELA